MEHVTYILFSRIKNRYYIGFTSNLEERIIHHNKNIK
ncbi:GIY-YIG nuclease family protein [Flavobacterium sp. LB2P6]